MIETMRIILGLTFLIIFLLIAFKTRKVEPMAKMLAFIVFEFLLAAGLLLLSFWSLNMSFKKAVITNLDNRRILSSEMLIVTGYVHNVGKYTINKAFLDVKILNAVSGKAKAPEKNRDGSDRSNTLEKSFIIAKDLRPGEQRAFRATMKYPAYFNLTDVKTHLSWN